MADKVNMVYTGPDGLVFDQIAVFNEGNRRAEKGKTYEVDLATADSLDVYEGWNEEGEDSPVEQIEAQRGDEGPKTMEEINQELKSGGPGENEENEGDE
jgi:hypothetical protein